MTGSVGSKGALLSLRVATTPKEFQAISPFIGAATGARIGQDSSNSSSGPNVRLPKSKRNERTVVISTGGTALQLAAAQPAGNGSGSPISLRQGLDSTLYSTVTPAGALTGAARNGVHCESRGVVDVTAVSPTMGRISMITTFFSTTLPVFLTTSR